MCPRLAVALLMCRLRLLSLCSLRPCVDGTNLEISCSSPAATPLLGTQENSPFTLSTTHTAVAAGHNERQAMGLPLFQSIPAHPPTCTSRTSEALTRNQHPIHPPTALTRLSLTHNKLASLPNCFESIPNLQVLIIDDNELKQLPDSICTLLNLKVSPSLSLEFMEVISKVSRRPINPTMSHPPPSSPPPPPPSRFFA